MQHKPTKTPGVFSTLNTTDHHFGSPEGEALDRAIAELVLPELKARAPELDLFTFCGDLFHCRLSLNDSAARSAVHFVHEVARICSKHSVAVRMLQGTLTHDYQQLEVFRRLTARRNLDLRIISEAEAEVMAGGFRALWMPEEYVEDAEEYYGPLLDDPEGYDGIWLHGTTDFVGYVAYATRSQGGRHAPVFAAKRLAAACRGAVVCGHIHGWHDWKGKIFYPGSLNRWVHGEPEPKRILAVTHDLRKGRFRTEQILNPHAPEYVDYDAAGEDAAEVAREVRALRAEGKRVRVLAPPVLPGEEGGGPDGAAALLRAALAGEAGVLVQGPPPSPRSAAADERYAFLLKGNLRVEEAVMRFVKVSKGIDLTSEQVSRALARPGTV